MVANAQATSVVLANSANVTPSQIGALVTSIEQASSMFTVERASFGGAANEINNRLRSALSFAQAAASLVNSGMQGAPVQSRLQKVTTNLSRAYELMLPALKPTVASLVADTAPAVIGTATTLSSASNVAPIAPGSLAAVSGDAGVSPLSSVSVSAPNYASIPAVELGGTSVTVGGIAAPVFYASPSRIAFFVPPTSQPGEADVIVTTRAGDLSIGRITIAAIAPGVFTKMSAAIAEGAALNMASYTKSSFNVTTQANLSYDRRTRVMLFATGFSINSANTNPNNDVRVGDTVIPNVAESVIVEARLSDGRVVKCAVEFAGATRRMPGLDQVNFILPGSFRATGLVEVTLVVNGIRSNTSFIEVS